MSDYSNMVRGSSILVGDNTVPGMQLDKKLQEILPKIHQECREMGLDYYPVIIELVRYDEMAELASYVGFPVRYPHWQWGMLYEEYARGYEYNMYRISEMVINNNPCYIYCMDSNTLVDNVNVICHAIGHNDFFKNNVFFAHTDRNMINKMADHAARIRSYMSRWGEEAVIEFIDHVLRIDTLVDPASAWKKRKIKPVVVRDQREYQYPKRLRSTHEYMDDWVNPREYIKQQEEQIREKEQLREITSIDKPVRDIMGFLKERAPLKPWQQDIISMLHEEALYFYPQRQTKMINEGWASFVDFHLLCRRGLVSLGQPRHDMGIIEYADHKSKVLGGKYSTNPYKLGFELFLDIEDRWNKGKFGPEWENCDDQQQKKNWDKKLGMGMEKCFEVRKYYNDYMMIAEFFTRDFCERMEFFTTRRNRAGDIILDSRDYKKIKKELLMRYANGGLPHIVLLDDNYKGEGHLLLEHRWQGMTLDWNYAVQVLKSLSYLWGRNVYLMTKDEEENELILDAWDMETKRIFPKD